MHMDVLRIGHRGASGYAPENTMAAFRQAIALGCDAVELDIHRTLDGHLVCHHDYWLGRTSSGGGLLRDLTLAQIQAEDAGTWMDARYGGERVPTLREALALLTGAGLQVIIELKSGSIHYPGIEQELVGLVREMDLAQRVQISSFDHRALRLIRELAPDLHLGMLYDGNPLDPVGMARAIGANSLHSAWQFTQPEVVREAHAAGLQVYVWTVNDAPYMALMKACGVDGIMSDYPDRL